MFVFASGDAARKRERSVPTQRLFGGNMRIWVLLAILSALVSSGCTHLSLKRNTLRQASTLSDLQYQQVLNNLAMFSCNPDALPWHLKLNQGVVQVSDQGAIGVVADVLRQAQLNIAGSSQRAVAEQWTGEPAVASDDLELLSLAYRKASNPADPQLDREIRLAIYELVQTFDLAPGSEMLLDIMTDSATAEFERMQAELDKVPLDMSEAKQLLNRAFTTLEDLLDKQRLGEKCLPEETVKETLANFAGDLTQACELARSAAHQSRSKETQEALKKLSRRIDLMSQPESLKALTKIIPHLNPFQHGLCRKDDEELANPFVAFSILVGHSDYVIPQAKQKPQLRNVGVINQAEEKASALMELLDEEKFNTPWFFFGRECDVPRCACYVGHYCHCGCDCYVWVMPDQWATLKDFTLTILTLAPLEGQESGGGLAVTR